MSSGSGSSKSVDKAKAKGKKVAQEIESDEAPISLIALGGYKPLPGVLRLVLVVDPVENIRNYALIPFPETYEEAQEAAVETLGEHMIDPKPANVELRGIMRGRDGNWISSFIRPQDWSVIVAPSFCEVLVVDKVAVKQELTKDASSPGQDGPKDNFLHGHLWITAGKKANGRMEWTKVQMAVYTDSRGGNQPGQPVTPWINRPTSYQEALELVTELMNDDFNIKSKLDPSAPIRSGKLPQPNETNKFPVKFYTFATSDNSTSAWRPFPEAAYAHEKVWRKIVPMPHEKLGVAVHI